MILIKINRGHIPVSARLADQHTVMVIVSMTISNMISFLNLFLCSRLCCFFPFTLQSLFIEIRKKLQEQRLKLPLRALLHNIIIDPFHLPVPAAYIIFLPQLHILISFSPHNSARPVKFHQIVDCQHDFIFAAYVHFPAIEIHAHHKRIPIPVAGDKFSLCILHQAVNMCKPCRIQTLLEFL